MKSNLTGSTNPVAGGYTVTSLTVQGQPQATQPDATTDPIKMDFVVNPDYVPAQAGTYLVVVTAVPNLGGAPITVTASFRVLAAGQDTTIRDDSASPTVLSTNPRNGALRVATTAFISVVFSQPVLRPGKAGQVTT